MKKKILLLTVVAALLAVPVFAAVTSPVNRDEQCGPFNGGHQQMIGQAVKDGTISGEEAAVLKESMEKTAPIMQKMMKSQGMTNNEMMKSCGTYKQ